MGITIEKIEDNEHFDYIGDVHVTGNIGANVTVNITDGSLIVDGNIGNQSEINLVQETQSFTIISSSIFMSNVQIGGATTERNLQVKGNVGDSVSFKSHNANFVVEGSLGNQCTLKTHNGKITTGNIGLANSLTSHNGNISCGNVGTNSSLKTHNGSINAKDMGENSNATSHNGDVRVNNAPKSARLDTHNGSVYENGVKRKKEKAKASSSVSIGGMTFIGGGRIIVNGKDITDIVNASNPASAFSSKEEPPVRYFKQ